MHYIRHRLTVLLTVHTYASTNWLSLLARQKLNHVSSA